jgi:glycosyltransferase involved in cell wall biosynthesis
VRIVQLTDFYRPTIGGLERHVETLSRESVNLGHEVTVVTLRTGDRPEREEIDGVRIVRINGWSTRLSALYADPNRPFHPTFPDPGALAALRRTIAELKPEIVHSHSWLEYSYFPLVESVDSAPDGPGHVVTLHDYGLSCAKKTYQYESGTCSGPGLIKCLRCATKDYGPVRGPALALGQRAGRRLLRRADAYLAISSTVAAAARQVLPPDMEIDIVPSMVPVGLPELAETTPRPDFLPPEDGYLLFVGALGPHKGVDVLLEAHRRLRNRVPLVLIGTPRPDTPAVDVPDVYIVRDVPSAKVMSAWRRCSVAVVPSVWEEPMGQVAVEAMLAERPVVASDVGGLRDIVVDGETGFRVPPRDSAALAEAIDRLLDDPVLQKRMGLAGREKAGRYTAQVVVPEVLEVFETVLERRARNRDSVDARSPRQRPRSGSEAVPR